MKKIILAAGAMACLFVGASDASKKGITGGQFGQEAISFGGPGSAFRPFTKQSSEFNRASLAIEDVEKAYNKEDHRYAAPLTMFALSMCGVMTWILYIINNQNGTKN